MVQGSSVCSSSSSYSGFFTEGLRAISQRGHRKTASLPCTPSLSSASPHGARVLDIANHPGCLSHPYAYAQSHPHDNDDLRDNDDICILPAETNYVTASCPQSPLLGSCRPRPGAEMGMYSNSRSVLSWASRAAAGDDAHDAVHPILDGESDTAPTPTSSVGAGSPSTRLDSSTRRRASPDVTETVCSGRKLANRASLLLSSIPHPSTGCISLTKSLRHLSSPLKKEIRPAAPSGELEGCGHSGSEKHQNSSTQAVSVKLSMETYQTKLQISDPFGSSPNSQSFFIDLSNSTPNTPTKTTSSSQLEQNGSFKTDSSRTARHSFLSFSSASSSTASVVSILDMDIPSTSRSSARHRHTQTEKQVNANPSSSSLPTMLQPCRRRLSFAPSKRPRSEPDTHRPHSTAFEFDPARVSSLDPQLPAEHTLSASSESRRNRSFTRRIGSVRHRHSAVASTSPGVQKGFKTASVGPVNGSDFGKSVAELDWRQFHVALLEDEIVL
jgi:hypothetical protein